MDLCSKILSRILTSRLYMLLGKHGTKYQFGATPRTGCPDVSFTLKSMLHLRRQHNLPTYVAFVDLVKAFDIANHELLINLLKRYGAPDKFASVIKRLYTNLKLVLKIGKEEASILQTIGVRQGDNMSPVLFLFFMTAFAKKLEEEWDKEGIAKAIFQQTPFDKFKKGQLIGHKISESEYWFDVIQTLYLDDGAFIFESRTDMIKGITLIKRTFEMFGLEMHIGRGDTPSKTECVFFPQPEFFLAHSLTLCKSTDTNNIMSKKE